MSKKAPQTKKAKHKASTVHEPKTPEAKSRPKVKAKPDKPTKAAAADQALSAEVSETHSPGTDNPELPPLDSLTPRQVRFIDEYLIDQTGTKAVIRAGYSRASASEIACRLLKNPIIKAHVEAGLADLRERARLTKEAILSQFESIVTADPNSLTEHRRVCCRHCWGGPEFLYQETPAELRERQRLHQIDVELAQKASREPPVWDGTRVLGYNGTKDPNPECPECWGEGQGRVFYHDTRFLNERDRVLFDGVEIGKDGVKVRVISKEKARDALAKHHKLYEPDGGVNVIVATPQELDAIYEDAMRKSREGSERVIGRSGRMEGNQDG